MFGEKGCLREQLLIGRQADLLNLDNGSIQYPINVLSKQRGHLKR